MGRVGPPDVVDDYQVPGSSPNSRARVATSGPDPDEPIASATRELSATLAAPRYAANLTQPELAALIGCSVTAVGHAETGRTWQSRRFWERADSALSADGELLRLCDARRRAAHPSASETDAAGLEPDLVCVLIVWRDGSVTTVPDHLADITVATTASSPTPLASSPSSPCRTNGRAH